MRQHSVRLGPWGRQPQWKVQLFTSRWWQSLLSVSGIMPICWSTGSYCTSNWGAIWITLLSIILCETLCVKPLDMSQAERGLQGEYSVGVLVCFLFKSLKTHYSESVFPTVSLLRQILSLSLSLTKVSLLIYLLCYLPTSKFKHQTTPKGPWVITCPWESNLDFKAV